MKSNTCFHYLFLICLVISSCGDPETDVSIKSNLDAPDKLEMIYSGISAAPDKPNTIKVWIDFKSKSDSCIATISTPEIKSSYSYHISAQQLELLESLLTSKAFESLQETYAVSKTDQPASTLKLSAGSRVITIKDYGLEGPGVLKEIYQIVYH